MDKTAPDKNLHSVLFCLVHVAVLEVIGQSVDEGRLSHSGLAKNEDIQALGEPKIARKFKKDEFPTGKRILE